MNNKIEIMAPVGSFESLTAAIQAGANAIYFGVGDMNMRSHSASVNFTIEDIEAILIRCREKQLKSYLTINTVIYDSEMDDMQCLVNAAKNLNVTAIIASDQSVMHYARSVGMEIHLSTQVNISNLEAVKFYSTFADVMVLARELNIDQVKFISEGIKRENILGPSGELVRLEMFVHGALCMSISGKCYLSLHEFNKSANRGKCFQTCRRGYTVSDRETGEELAIENQYIMSPKDLCTIHFLDRIIDAGVTILKIEGRARSADYVKTVTTCYREAVESIATGSFSHQKAEQWKMKLATVFNRGFWDGYYLGQKLGEWNDSYGSKATERKVYIGKVSNYFSKIGVAELKLEANSLDKGDSILIMGDTTGVYEGIAEEIRVNLKVVDVAGKGVCCSISVTEPVRRSDKVYKLKQSESVVDTQN